MSPSSPGPAEDRLILTDEPEPIPEPRRHTGLAVAGAVGLLVGGLLTWAGFSALTQPPPPLTITQESFPLTLLDMRREDYHARTTEHEPSIELLDKEFQSQLERHRFTYGGDGATFTYQRSGEQVFLTIVNGVLHPDLPDEQAGIEMTYESDDVRCTSLEFRHVQGNGEVILVAEDGTIVSDETTTLSWTNCVLHDEVRGVSLQLRDDSFTDRAGGTRARELTEALRDLHADLVG